MNILDRNRQQVVKDQHSDVTLAKARETAGEHPPEEGNNGFHYDKGLLLHRKSNDELHNGKFYNDRVVVPESYRAELLRVAHSIPLSGHMALPSNRCETLL